MEQFNPCLRNFIAMGKSYEKALSSVTFAAKGYFDALVRMGEMASESQGSKDIAIVAAERERDPPKIHGGRNAHAFSRQRPDRQRCSTSDTQPPHPLPAPPVTTSTRYHLHPPAPIYPASIYLYVRMGVRGDLCGRSVDEKRLDFLLVFVLELSHGPWRCVLRPCQAALMMLMMQLRHMGGSQTAGQIKLDWTGSPRVTPTHAALSSCRGLDRRGLDRRGLDRRGSDRRGLDRRGTVGPKRIAVAADWLWSRLFFGEDGFL
ncbi:hypothetical protein NHX12_025168 [Muraenolepis orangiensis]|uniref:IMD domain-containing protein n=1 Tax=Muraenolepis orangiensis TaxID=630683 RepID=A0A9Q0EMB2_9TELE|nr:hypothetical protein NHX12_025168 [Muraenolepis orangiensis]